MPLDVDFGRVKLHSAVDQMYPPNFTILVNGQKAVQDSLVVFELKGTLPSGLVYEEPLCLSALRRSGVIALFPGVLCIYNYIDTIYSYIHTHRSFIHVYMYIN